LTQISNRRKAVAAYAAAGFVVVKPPVIRYWDSNHRSDLHILEGADCPQKGVKSYATVGLSEHPLIRNGKEFNARVELLGACGSEFSEFAEILSTVGFCVINSQWFCAPGVIFPGVLDLHGASKTMSDIYFADPFLWGDRFKSSIIENQMTAWLLVIPISKRETEFAVQNGPDKLEQLFERQNIDIYNLNRPSVV